jgi:colicin import membrane protein
VVTPPTPPEPKPVVTPPAIMQTLEKVFTPEPVKPAPTPEPTHKPQISTQLVTRPTPKNSPASDNSQQQRQARAISSAVRNLEKNFTSGTKVGMPGTGTESYTSYGTVILSVYRHAWVSPDGMASDNAIVKFSVTIASDGTVISSRITDPSGDANIDSAVQRMLDRVTFIAPFPEGATEKQRSYPVNFNATRRTLE